jgi:SP family galactose:H+ symporter-like MFS transporter
LGAFEVERVYTQVDSKFGGQLSISPAHQILKSGVAMKLDRKVLLPSLSGLQYGYNTSVIAGASIFVTKTFSLSDFQAGILVSIAMIGLCLASFAGILSNIIGRKPSLILSAICMMVGGLLCFLAPHFISLLVGRFLVGLGCGIAIVVAPIYLTEVAPANVRGRILNLNQIGIAVGALIAYLCSYLFEDWRMLFGVAVFPALIQGVGLFFIEESCSRAQRSEASWKKLVLPSYRSRFNLVLGLSLFQALTGNAAVFFFAPSVFQSVGFSDPKSSLLATTLIGVVGLLAILFSFWAVDHLGRRFLLFLSLLGIALSLFCIFLFPSPMVTLIAVLFYVAFYFLGMGPIPPIVIGEISPVNVRGHVMSLMGGMGWMTNYFVTVSFLPLIDTLGTGGTFFIYAVFCIVGFGFLYVFLPETKMKSFEEIDHLFNQKRL